MKLLFLIFSISIIICSCYTVVQKDSSRNPGNRALPDLKIVEANIRAEQMIIADDPDSRPMIGFSLRVANVGRGNFEGAVVLGWADLPNDIASNQYPNFQVFSPINGSILAGDTIVINTDQRHSNYFPGMVTRFVIATQSMMPVDNCNTFFSHAPNIVEANYENNFYEYIIN